MTFTETELAYLASQRLGRLATMRPDGQLQVSPVGYRVDPATHTIVIHGMRMDASRKYRNVAANGRAAFVVDDLATTQPWRPRCVEIRGHAETGTDANGPFIRVVPERILSFGLDPDDSPARAAQHRFRSVTPNT